jgi:hypothetical protein
MVESRDTLTGSAQSAELIRCVQIDIMPLRECRAWS